MLNILDGIALKYDASVGQIALNYSANKDYVGTLLVGASKPKHAQENCKAFEFNLEKEDIILIDRKIEELGLNK